jgi:transposase
MEGTAVVVGIDVSKDRLDVHVRPSGETLTVERTAAGLDALCSRLRQIVSVRWGPPSRFEPAS